MPENEDELNIAPEGLPDSSAPQGQEPDCVPPLQVDADLWAQVELQRSIIPPDPPGTRRSYDPWSSPGGPRASFARPDPLGRAITGVGNWGLANPMTEGCPPEIMHFLLRLPDLCYELLRVAWLNTSGLLRLMETNPALLYLIGNYVSAEYRQGRWQEEEAAALLLRKWSYLAELFGIPGQASTLSRIRIMGNTRACNILLNRRRRIEVFASPRSRWLRYLPRVGNDALEMMISIKPELMHPSVLLLAGRYDDYQIFGPLYELQERLLVYGTRPVRWQWGELKSPEELHGILERVTRETDASLLDTPYPPPPITPDGYYQAPQNYGELCTVGRSFGNCAESVHSQLMQGQAALYYREGQYPHERHCVLLNRHHNGDWLIAQIVGPENSIPSLDVMEAANRWFSEIAEPYSYNAG